MTCVTLWILSSENDGRDQKSPKRVRDAEKAQETATEGPKTESTVLVCLDCGGENLSTLIDGSTVLIRFISMHTLVLMHSWGPSLT